MFLILSSQRPCEEVGRLLLSVLYRRGNRTQSGRAGPGSRGHSQARCLHPRAGGTDGTLRRSSAAGFPAGTCAGRCSLWTTRRLSRNSHHVPGPPAAAEGRGRAGARRIPGAGTDRRAPSERAPHCCHGPGAACNRRGLQQAVPGAPRRNPVSKGEVGKDPPRLVPPSPLKR